MTRPLVRAGVLVLLAVVLAGGQQPPASLPQDVIDADRRIVTEIAEHSEQLQNLEYLSDRIGPRLTGSGNLKRANEWTAQRFRDYGLANVHLESWTIAHSWKRGWARARVVGPAEHRLAAEAAGWSPNTAGALRGPLVYVKADNKEELEPYRGKLGGAIVITTEPQPRLRVEERPLMPRPPQPERDFAALRRFSQEREDFFVAEGVIGLLRDSDKSFGLFNMSSVGRDYNPAKLPTAFLTPESYDLLWRLRKNDQAVTVELEIGGGEFSAGPVEVYNTVAEIPGGDKRDEVVILGAHLDSWDLGTGATDNGTGASVLLEAARALRKLDLKPRRTLRFVLFSGEEQGLNGSRAYVEAHKEEMAKVSAVLVHDAGTGRVETIALQANPQVYDVVSRIVRPLRQMLNLDELSLRTISGSDHASFNRVGVPGFFCQQERATYGQTHHSQADTFDKVIREDLLNGAQVLAVFAYNVAQLDEMLPRKPAPPPVPQP
jgi:hypothetical protein